MKLGEKSKAKIEQAPDIKGSKLKPAIEEMPTFADQKDTDKGNRLNAGNYEYTNALNQPVQTLTDKIIGLLLREELTKMLPSIPLTKKK